MVYTIHLTMPYNTNHNLYSARRYCTSAKEQIVLVKVLSWICGSNVQNVMDV